MGYLPVNLRLKGRRCLVVGGGAVGERKARTLVNYTEHVTVIAPDVTPGIGELERGGRVNVVRETYRAGHLRGAFLAVAATDDPRTNIEVCRDAGELGVMVNAVDSRENCDYIMPSVLKRGALTIAVSTGGTSPVLAGRIRRDIEEMYGREYGVLLEAMEAAKPTIKRMEKLDDERRALFFSLLEGDVLDIIRGGAPLEEVVRRIEEYALQAG